MAYTYEYEIGATQSTMTNIEDIISVVPRGMAVQPFSVIRKSVSGKQYGDGYPTVTWHFDAITPEDLDTLLDYIGDGNQSAQVYIKTRNLDGSYTTYTGYMHRPVIGRNAHWDLSIWRDVDIVFTTLVEVT